MWGGGACGGPFFCFFSTTPKKKGYHTSAWRNMPKVLKCQRFERSVQCRPTDILYMPVLLSWIFRYWVGDLLLFSSNHGWNGRCSCSTVSLCQKAVVTPHLCCRIFVKNPDRWVWWVKPSSWSISILVAPTCNGQNPWRQWRSSESNPLRPLWT